LARDGRSAFEDETARFSDAKSGLDSELRRIQAQEAIDAIESSPDDDGAFFSRLVNSDDAIGADGERTLNGWVEERLHFVHQKLGANVSRYLHDVRRPTLIPPFETLARFRACIDENPAPGYGKFQIPLQPITFDRTVAEKTHVQLLRVGHPFMQALEEQLRNDDRGTAFALWRYIPHSVQTPRFFFRFDLLVECDLEPVARLGSAVITSRQALRRRADEAFPVDYRTVWLNSDLVHIKNAKWLALLNRPYAKEAGSDGVRDVNIRIELWERAATLAQFGDWSDHCSRARNVAEGVVRSDPHFLTQCAARSAQARDLSLATANAFASRIARLRGAVREAEEHTAHFEENVNAAIIEGISHPSIRVDSVGVLVLASTPLGEQ
jgi:ATP-dependent helicase HepA